MRKEDVLEVLIPEEKLKEICKDLGKQISLYDFTQTLHR